MNIFSFVLKGENENICVMHLCIAVPQIMSHQLEAGPATAGHGKVWSLCSAASPEAPAQQGSWTRLVKGLGKVR